MEPQYQLLDQQDPSTDELNPNINRPHNTMRWQKLGILILAVSNLATLIFLYRESKSTDRTTANFPPISSVLTKFDWYTDYSDRGNRSKSDALWDAILPSHGIVAVDSHWAREQNWPTSMRLPDNHSKEVYLLEAYHQLHCLRILRKTFFEAIDGRPYTWDPSKHMEHCFDAIRQSIQCYADNTPLFTFGKDTAGDGQLHKCRDWSQLRDWATQNSACYRDTIDDVLLRDHFGYCDDGTDGLMQE